MAAESGCHSFLIDMIEGIDGIDLLSRPFGTPGCGVVRHRTALRLYGVKHIQPRWGCGVFFIYGSR